MLVRQVTTDKSGVTTDRMVDLDVLTPEQQAPIDAANAQLDANAATLQQQAANALDNLRAYRDNASPSNADTVKAVKLLCKVAIGLIRMRLAKFDATD
jgi:hypothetical protein